MGRVKKRKMPKPRNLVARDMAINRRKSGVMKDRRKKRLTQKDRDALAWDFDSYGTDD